MLGTTDAWLISHSSHPSREPAYYIEDCRILNDKSLVRTFLLWDHWPNGCIYLLYCHSNLLKPKKLFDQPFHLLMQSHFYKIPCQNPPRNHGLWYVGLLGLGLQNHRQYGCKAFYQCVQAEIFHFLACKRPSLWNLKEMINWGIHFKANMCIYWTKANTFEIHIT